MSKEAAIYGSELTKTRYKCYAAHIAQLYVSKAAQKHLRTLGHFFKSTDNLENLLGLAAGNYEITASIPSAISYLESLSWDAIADYEEKLQAILIDYLNSKPDIYQIYGEPVSEIMVESFLLIRWSRTYEWILLPLFSLPCACHMLTRT
jgi:selenocysteine lyase/cysteine desulfurase